MALVLGQNLGIFPLRSGEEMSDKGQEASLLEVCKFPERITALCWISYAGCPPAYVKPGQCAKPCETSAMRHVNHAVAGESSQLQDTCLLLATSLGYLQLHTQDGHMLHRQRLHTSEAQSIQARNAGMGMQLMPIDSVMLYNTATTQAVTYVATFLT